MLLQCEYRINEAYHSPHIELFFGFEMRVLPYVPCAMETIRRFVIVVSDYLLCVKHNNFEPYNLVKMYLEMKNISMIYHNFLRISYLLDGIIGKKYIDLLNKYLQLDLKYGVNVYDTLNHINQHIPSVIYDTLTKTTL